MLKTLPKEDTMAIFAEKLRSRLAKRMKSFLFSFMVNTAKKYHHLEGEKIPRWLVLYLFVVLNVSFGIITLLDPNYEFFPDDADFPFNDEKDDTGQQEAP